MTNTIPTIFPTTKNPKHSVFARLPLMRKGLMQFDVDPDVVSISAFPFETEHWSATSEDEPVKRVHIPDVAILIRQVSFKITLCSNTARYCAISALETPLTYWETRGSG